MAMVNVWVVNGHLKTDENKSSKACQCTGADAVEVLRRFVKTYPEIEVTALTYKGSYEELAP